MAQKNRWHPVMLPDDYLRKLKQDLSEVEAQVVSKTRYELVHPKPRTSGVPPLRRCTQLPLVAARAPVAPWGEPTMHWSACFLPDDYLRKLKQDLAEAEAMVESKTRYVPDPDFSPPPDDDTPPP